MKILGISGSPKKNGNSEQMINRVLAMAEKREFNTEKAVSYTHLTLPTNREV